MKTGNSGSEQRRTWRRRRGATMVEYGLMLACIAVALIAVVSILTQTFKLTYGEVNTGIQTALDSDASGVATAGSGQGEVDATTGDVIQGNTSGTIGNGGNGNANAIGNPGNGNNGNDGANGNSNNGNAN